METLSIGECLILCKVSGITFGLPAASLVKKVIHPCNKDKKYTVKPLPSLKTVKLTDFQVGSVEPFLIFGVAFVGVISYKADEPTQKLLYRIIHLII